MDLLLNGISWVVWSFSDGSERCICTTLNKELLGRLGVQPKENYLYDLDHREFVRLREDVDTVLVLDKKPEYKKEVLDFASRFI